ncbi:hypothetical protein KIH87_11820 [Paraneptunicella aestuarii]|uniref:RAMP superfamily CRISPR-associated protein n=1 Tax=Paraneptunicella aestuarii TaxID=2831148 RepID=UPI001E2B3A53|nr:RAMP superfamily CRISPR-associated protein [Paraneptunicella aestuarii]UAA37402.1 hypothetical protein KIH87_11820 [Paraneptunicella aestuarii]
MSQPYVNSYTFTLTLLEDTHIGTGVGNGLVDSFNTRDDQGYPIIWRQHLKGILREAAFDWARFTGNKEHLKTVNALFGAERENLDQGCLIVFSAELSEEDKQVRSPESFFIELSSTALGKQAHKDTKNEMSKERSLYNRAAQDASLRTKQYMRAGTEFTCRYQFFGVSSDQSSKLKTYQEAMLCILKRMYALGSQKHRATGAIQLGCLKPTPEIENASVNQQSKVEFKGENTLVQLTLEALEPVRLPSTNKPGNVVPTDTFIDGNKMLGALANWCKQNKQPALFNRLINGELGVGYAYPVPASDVNFCFPLPQHFGVAKAGASQGAVEGEQEQAGSSAVSLPWWFNNTKTLPQVNAPVVGEREGESSAPKLKKVGEGHYVSFVKDKADSWALLKQKTAIHMRNGLTNRDSKRDDANLFTEEVLPKGTLFSCQLCVPTKALLEELNHGMLTGLLQGQPLLIGRGGAPVRVVNAVSVAKPKMPAITEKTSSVTVVTTSPWLVYDDNLQPYSELSVEMLAKALNLNGETIPEEHLFKRSSTTAITGFNPASGLPKRSEQAIAAGSVLHFDWQNLTHEQRELVTQLLVKLFEKPAIGQRQAQGLGRFYVYADVPELVWASAGTQEANNSSSPYCNTEKLYEQADLLWKDKISDSLKKTIKDTDKNVSKQQWQQLRQKVRRLEYEHASGTDSSSAIADLFKQFTKREIHNNAWLSVEQAFKVWEEEIKGKVFGDQITFSLYFFDKIWLHITADKQQVNDKEAAE